MRVLRLPPGSNRALTSALALVGAAATAPLACLFPSYVYDLPGGGGTSSSGTAGHGTTSSSSASSSSGVPCASRDCSDPLCADSFSCVPSLPAGWTGYFAVYDGPSAGDPGCTAAYPTQQFLGNTGFSAAPATCACTCDKPTGETCTVPSTLEVTDAPCGAQDRCYRPLPTDWTAPCANSTASPDAPGGQEFCGPSATDCNSGSFADCNLSATMGATTVSDGSCNPSPVTVTKTTPSWQSVGEACGGVAMTATGCNASQVCLPRPAPGFAPTACVMKAGNDKCPAGQFTHGHVFYTDFIDSRACTNCGCDPPIESSCSATVTAYAPSTGCTGTPVATLHLTSAAGDCATLSGNPTVGARQATTTAPSGGRCPTNGGQPSGAAAPDEGTAVTFCCL